MPLIGAIYLLIAHHVGIVDEGQRIANQPLLDFGPGKFGTRAIVLQCLDRFPVKPATQHIGIHLLFSCTWQGQYALHLGDGLDPLLMTAGHACCGITHLMAVVAGTDERRPVFLGIFPGKPRVVGRGREGIRCGLGTGKRLERQVDPDQVVVGE